MSDAIGSEYITAPIAVTTTATTTASTAAVEVLGATAMPGLYTFIVKGSDVHVLFGNAAVVAATTTNGAFWTAGSREDMYITADSRYFRVIATDTVAGQAFQFYRSGP
jgi:hypothetical protein